jgi:biotin operon repressor
MSDSQTSRILAVLWDGREHSVPEIHRKAGTSRLNSRISDLRKKGYEIECRRRPHRIGASAYAYRLVSTPPDARPPEVQVEWERAVSEAESKREQIPRDLLHRYRLYAVRKGNVLDILGATATPAEIGEMIVSMGREGLLTNLCIGLLDTYGTETTTGTWIVNPWDQ